jgi:hypothetical protein
MKYNFTVPPTENIGSFAGVCQDGFGQNFRQDALWQYNSAREHDGFEPVKRMPAGTEYRGIFDYDIEGDFGCGWEILCSEDSYSEAMKVLKLYRENQPGIYRIKKRAQK